MKKDYATILLEDIRDQNKAILEGLREVPKRVEFNELKQDVAELKQDMKVVKAAVQATNRDLAALDQQVTRLEAA
jgi:septal ring factor EnvC (AmiA/AmiB activator)